VTRPLDRRQFLKRASGVLIGFAHLKGAAHAASQSEASSVSSADWQDLARSLKGPLLKKGHPEFAKIAKPWNLYYASTAPQGIARCASADDVRSSLLWAASNGVSLAIRSGGHSYAGYSTTSGLLVDVSLMNEVAIHGAEGLVRMGAARATPMSMPAFTRSIAPSRMAAAWEWALPDWCSVEGLASANGGMV
jgi:hypothetical protein